MILPQMPKYGEKEPESWKEQSDQPKSIPKHYFNPHPAFSATCFYI
jgi:hypothetical protein